MGRLSIIRRLQKLARVASGFRMTSLVDDDHTNIASMVSDLFVFLFFLMYLRCIHDYLVWRIYCSSASEYLVLIFVLLHTWRLWCYYYLHCLFQYYRYCYLWYDSMLSCAVRALRTVVYFEKNFFLLFFFSFFRPLFFPFREFVELYSLKCLVCNTPCFMLRFFFSYFFSSHFCARYFSPFANS